MTEVQDISAETTKIIFVLGKPGCGKGTLCTNLQSKLPITFFSAGQLLRDEVQLHPDSEESKLVQEDMKAGRIVKPEITVRLLKNAMNQQKDAKVFMIDGFPRELGQYEFIQQQIDPKRCYLIHMKCEDNICFERIYGRKSGRLDDNEETINNRIQNFNSETTKVIKLFQEMGRLIEIDSTHSK